MFNTTKLDEICVQETHLEERGKNVSEETSEKSFKYREKAKGKFKGKNKRNALVKKEGEKLTCMHYSKEGHDEDHCWKLHPEMRPKNLITMRKKILLQLHIKI